MLRSLGVETREVRMPRDLAGLDGLVIPGGESTTIGQLLETYALLEPVRARGASGFPIWGTCAGLILLAKDVGTPQPVLGLMDVAVERNAFGRQTDSFETDLEFCGLSGGALHAVFIRAPIVSRRGRQRGGARAARRRPHRGRAARKPAGNGFPPRVDARHAPAQSVRGNGAGLVNVSSSMLGPWHVPTLVGTFVLANLPRVDVVTYHGRHVPALMAAGAALPGVAPDLQAVGAWTGPASPGIRPAALRTGGAPRQGAGPYAAAPAHPWRRPDPAAAGNRRGHVAAPCRMRRGTGASNPRGAPVGGKPIPPRIYGNRVLDPRQPNTNMSDRPDRLATRPRLRGCALRKLPTPGT